MKSITVTAEKNKIHNLISDSFWIAFGLFLYALGTSFFYKAELGSSSYATLCQGLSIISGFSIGIISLIISIVAFLLLLLFDGKKINIGTLISMFSGILVDPINRILANMTFLNATFQARMITLLLGIIITSVGFGLYMAIDRGASPVDGLMQYFSIKGNIQLKYGQMIEDALFIALGISFGADYGIGTILAMIFTGPIMQLIYDRTVTIRNTIPFS